MRVAGSAWTSVLAAWGLPVTNTSRAHASTTVAVTTPAEVHVCLAALTAAAEKFASVGELGGDELKGSGPRRKSDAAMGRQGDAAKEKLRDTNLNVVAVSFAASRMRCVDVYTFCGAAREVTRSYASPCWNWSRSMNPPPCAA